MDASFLGSGPNVDHHWVEGFWKPEERWLNPSGEVQSATFLLHSKLSTSYYDGQLDFHTYVIRKEARSSSCVMRQSEDRTGVFIIIISISLQLPFQDWRMLYWTGGMDRIRNALLNRNGKSRAWPAQCLQDKDWSISKILSSSSPHLMDEKQPSNFLYWRSGVHKCDMPKPGIP